MLFQDFQPLGAIATTPSGVSRLQPICQASGAIWVPESLSGLEGTQVYSDSLKSHVAELWQSHRAFVFCLATGAVTRIIAPLLQDKATDPAVVVVDEAGKFVISLSGGHQGGADNLTKLIAQLIGATPILTSAAIVRGESVQVVQETGSTLWQTTSSFEQSNFSLEGTPDTKAKIWITSHTRHPTPDTRYPQIYWHPRVLWVGIGCERGTSKELIETAIKQVCRENQLAEGAIAGIATIEIKADEVGLVELCRDRNFPLHTFPVETLRSISVPNPSQVVEREVGTPSVAEAAALRACLDLPHAKTQSHKDSLAPLRLCATPHLLVPKQIFKPNTCTGGFNQIIRSSTGISLSQIQEIYSGKITNWRQLGGPDLPIVPVSQDPDAQASSSFLLQGMPSSERRFGKNVQIVRDTTTAIRKVAAIPGGFGYGAQALVVGQQTIKPLALAQGRSRNYIPATAPDGTVNKKALLDGSYPLIRRIFVIYREDGSLDEIAGRAYANLLLSTEGQQLVDRAGYLPIR